MQLDKNNPVNPAMANLGVIMLSIQYLHACDVRIAQAADCADVCFGSKRWLDS